MEQQEQWDRFLNKKMNHTAEQQQKKAEIEKRKMESDGNGANTKSGK